MLKSVSKRKGFLLHGVFASACSLAVPVIELWALCAGFANLRRVRGLEEPLDIQTLHNYGNSDLTFRAWPGLLWEPGDACSSGWIKRCEKGRAQIFLLLSLPPSLSASDPISYSRHPCTWCLHGVSGSSEGKLQNSLVQEAEWAQPGQENSPSFPGHLLFCFH